MKKMRKMISLFTIFVLMLALVSCGSGQTVSSGAGTSAPAASRAGTSAQESSEPEETGARLEETTVYVDVAASLEGSLRRLSFPPIKSSSPT